MSSKLLPGHAQVATSKAFTHARGYSNLVLAGSRRVAGWVAGWVGKIPFTSGFEVLAGSRCSTFFNNLRVEGKREDKERIRVTIGRSCYTCYPGPNAPDSNGPDESQVPYNTRKNPYFELVPWPPRLGRNVGGAS